MDEIFKRCTIKGIQPGGRSEYEKVGTQGHNDGQKVMHQTLKITIKSMDIRTYGAFKTGLIADTGRKTACRSAESTVLLNWILGMVGSSYTNTNHRTSKIDKSVLNLSESYPDFALWSNLKL